VPRPAFNSINSFYFSCISSNCVRTLGAVRSFVGVAKEEALQGRAMKAAFPEKSRANVSELNTVRMNFPPGDLKENETDFCTTLCCWYVPYSVVDLCSGR
jgi:hypothetical protein